LRRIFSYAAGADKFDGTVHNPPFEILPMAMQKRLERLASSARPKRLAGIFVSRDARMANGHTGDRDPSESYPLITSDLYSLFDTSDLPARRGSTVCG